MLALLLAACADFDDCETIDTSAVEALPARLSEAGLYAEGASSELSASVLPYEVRFELWSDGASKQRWLRLPEGASIDTSRPEDWDFPAGTRLFKEFSRDGVRLETRMLERLDDGRWGAVAYRWLPDGSDALALPEGEQDAGGTAHDVPDAASCVACHGGRQSFVLGFSAVQLSGAPGLLEELAASGVLSDPVAVQLPGDALDQEALGYLHANCSHCHNPERQVGETGHRCYDPPIDIDFTLPPSAGSVEALPALRTAEPFLGHGKHSYVLRVMSNRGTGPFRASMPPLGTEEVDEVALERMERWLERR